MKRERPWGRGGGHRAGADLKRDCTKLSADLDKGCTRMNFGAICSLIPLSAPGLLSSAGMSPWEDRQQGKRTGRVTSPSSHYGHCRAL